jgi:hypothetical protein
LIHGVGSQMFAKSVDLKVTEASII